jgi:hypothetical protein
MSMSDLPELEAIAEIIRAELPRGHHLEHVDLTVDTLYEGQEPAFTVLVELLEDEDADPGYGMAYNITQRIRRLWSRDDLYVKIHARVAGDRGAV